MDTSFFKGKKVFLTGHTGFKGSWLCQVLLNAGADICGYSLRESENNELFKMLNLADKMKSVEGDVRDLRKLCSSVEEFKPEIVFHLAAQPLVRESYDNPAYTYSTNVMGTVNICEAIRKSNSVRSFVNVTTDKVYLNKEWSWGYRECDELNGYDPYSNSKSCSELVTSSYSKSFFSSRGIGVSTCRAGNVIGGGDFSENRIIPDCIKAAIKANDIIVRNPNSIRPYQHVLDSLNGYMLVAQRQYNDASLSGAYNIGPSDEGCVTTRKLVDLFCDRWHKISGEDITVINVSDNGPHEANCLKLDCSKIRNSMGWKPVWGIEEAVEKTVEWTHGYKNCENIMTMVDCQIEAFLKS